jgi:hypothetical protein
VSEFLAYEPLADPLHPPAALPSPSSVLAWQCADAFDASQVLASLLLGAGFNAYVVFGYAPPRVTLNDQSGSTCPLLLDAATQQLLLAERPATASGSAGGSGSGAGATGSKAQQQSAGGGSSAAEATGAGGDASAAPAAGFAQLQAGAGKGSAAGGSASAGGTASTGGGASVAGRAGATPHPTASGAAGATASGAAAGAATAATLAAAAAGAAAAAAAAAADAPGRGKKYQVPPKPQLVSAFLRQHPELDHAHSAVPGGGSGRGGAAPACDAAPAEEDAPEPLQVSASTRQQLRACWLRRGAR